MKGKNSLFLIVFIFYSFGITAQIDDSVAIKNYSPSNLGLIRPGELSQSENEYLKYLNQDQSIFRILDTLKYSQRGYLMDREMLKLLVQKTDTLNNYLIEYCLSNIKLFGFSPISSSFIYDEVAEKMLNGKYFYSCDAFIFYSTEYEKSTYNDSNILEEINKSKRTDFINHLAWLYKDKRAYLLDQINKDISGCYHDNLLIILVEMDSKGY